MHDSPPPTIPDPPRVPRFTGPRRESLLPPRALPGFFGAASAAVVVAQAAAREIGNPEVRAVLSLACVLIAWLVGYVTPPPRRRFRRGDP